MLCLGCVISLCMHSSVQFAQPLGDEITTTIYITYGVQPLVHHA